MINYKNFPNNIYYCINYVIKHFCTGKSKFSNQIYENKLTKPYINIRSYVYNDNLCHNINDVFNKYIYFIIHTICNEKECISEDDKNINYYIKKYENYIFHLFYL